MESSANGTYRATKILIVDTDPRTVRELGAALRGEGWEALEATSYEEARRLWTSERPPMLIADIRLGQFNGLQLLLRARADRPDVTGVITSAIPDKVLEADTRRFGGTFVVKPLAREQIITLLQSLRPTAIAGRPASDSERRLAERRQLIIPGFAPDRRLTDRRRPLGT